jgi:pSer/pThr/pTyr-binding forkhead associated (FHA) protein
MIGAAADCDIVVDRSKISGHHARLSQVGRAYVPEDLGSTNGTFIDGVRIKTGAVTKGIRIGSIVSARPLSVYFAPAPPEAVALRRIANS